jgi:hypothetical protein
VGLGGTWTQGHHLCIFFCGTGWGLNSGLWVCKAGALLLELHLQPHLCLNWCSTFAHPLPFSSGFSFWIWVVYLGCLRTPSSAPVLGAEEDDK